VFCSFQKRRAAARQVSASGLDDEAKELLETNRLDRERMEEEISELKKRNVCCHIDFWNINLALTYLIELTFNARIDMPSASKLNKHYRNVEGI